MTAAFALVTAAASETGLVRKNNEDAAYSGCWLFAVADGMGGHAAGEIASAAVIESLRCQDEDVGADALLETLGRAVMEANAEVARRAAEDTARFGMGTTLTAMLWSGDRAALAHIGDSRAFRVAGRPAAADHRGSRARQSRLECGLTSTGALAVSRWPPGPFPDLGVRDPQIGDRYLICSDGLSPVVSSEEIRAVLTATADPGEAARELFALADGAGAPDNITAIIIDVRAPDGSPRLNEPVTLGAASAAVTR